jgi:hypothetical protein
MRGIPEQVVNRSDRVFPEFGVCRRVADSCRRALRAKAFFVFLLTACGFAAASLQAALPDEIQVYTDDINKPGESGLELHVNTTPRGTNRQDYPGEVTTHHGLRITPEFSYGLTRDFEAGLYLPIVYAGSDAALAGFKLRLKWLPLRGDEDTGGAFLGANAEYSNLAYRFSASRHNGELRLIGGYRNRDWLLAVNPVFIRAFSAGSPEPNTQFELGYKLSRRTAEGIGIGFEYYNEKGQWSRFDPGAKQGKTLFLALDVERKPWIFNAGIGRGLNQETDRWTVKMIFEIPFQ